MRIVFQITRPLALTWLVITHFTATTFAQEVSIPDPDLNAAIRKALQKPTGPLTETDLIGLTELDARFGNISSLQGLEAAHNLTTLEISFNALTRIDLPASLTKLSFLDLSANQLASFTLPAGFTNLSALLLDQNPLTNVTLPEDLAHLSLLRMCCTQITSLSLPPGLTNLAFIDLGSSHLTNLTFSSDLGSLTQLDLQNNQLAHLTLPVGLRHLNQLLLVGNPLTTFVLSRPLAATNLAAMVSTLRAQGVSVFTYPLAISLVSPRRTVCGAFEFALTGPPGNCAILVATNLTVWSALATVTNQLGSVVFTDVISSPQKFYHALLQGPPTNAVFVPPSTFTMGSPADEPGHNIFEGAQPTVTLTHPFWIGKYEVTQGEYLAVTGKNPSDFPGDLRRPISSVTWFDATNYCWKLTQQELAAGRIPPGSHYRLPTEAEWECAARAGTTTRFSYGDDDQNHTSLTNYAWFLDLPHPDLIVHPVGSKLPNPWGIYDMHGNVWEWCQDWYGDQVGGVQTDPQGPVTHAQGLKVMRGGAYDYDNSSCRSASRFFRPANQPDSDVGFRVVLVTEL